ncbi:MAG TPA: serine hydrolase [Steroidobacteraceae bacterium]|nr:serine hydrolase [Steroidobacteraceae bacterium]
MRPTALLLLIPVIVATLTGSADAQAGQFDLEKTKTVMSRLIEQKMKDRGVPSVSIALVRGDSIVWKAAFGYANVRTKTPATTDTLYSTGSTFKSATATALMQLAEQGKFKLDQPVNKYLGDVQVQDRLQAEKPVTFRHMLSHWSGLTAGAVTKPLWGRELPKSLEKMVGGLYSVRPPETKWEYNNFAYGMAGLLIEKISGQEYEKYMVEHVLAPLGVTTPHPVYPSPEMVEVMALPYEPGGPNGKPQPVEQVHFDVYPAGDIYLTAEDMARFLAMHLNGGMFRGKRILSEASVNAMHEPQFGGTYAFGFSVRKDPNGHTIINHNGGIPGQSSYMAGDLDAKVGVYFMSNSGAPAVIGEAALKLLRGEDYTSAPEPKIISLDPSLFDRYVGVYELSSDVAFTVSRDGNKLMLQQGDAPKKNELAATSPTSFVVKGQEFTVTFIAEPSGAITKLVLDTGSDKLDVVKQR